MRWTAAVALALIPTAAVADSSTTCTRMGMFVNCNTQDRSNTSLNNGVSAMAAAIAARRQERRDRQTVAPPVRPFVNPLTNGNSFLAECGNETSASPMTFGLCHGYVAGFLGRDTMTGDRQAVCLPSGVNNKQLMDVMLAHLRDHPESRNLPTDALALFAFSRAFPCQSAQTPQGK